MESSLLTNLQIDRLKINLKRLSFAVGMSLLASCASLPSNNSSSSGYAKSRELSAQTKGDLYEAIMAAEFATVQGDFETAINYYLFALNLHPDVEFAKEVIKLAQQNQDPLAVIEGSKAWLKLEPQQDAAAEAYVLGKLMLFDLTPDEREASINDAMNMLLKWIERQPDSTVVYHQLAGLNRIYLQNSTLNLWQEFVRQGKYPTLAWSVLSHSYYQAAINTKESSFLDKANQAIDAALRENSESPPSVELKVSILKAQNKEQEALNFLQSLLISNPKNVGALGQLAQELYRQKRYNSSLEIVDRWLKVEANNNEALYLKAANHYALTQFQASLDLFTQLIQNNYKLNTSLYYCGDTAERLKQFDLAQRCFEQVKDGDFWLSSQTRLSYLLINQKQEELALNRLDELTVSVFPEQAQSIVELKGDLLFRLNRPLEALEWLNRHINTELRALGILNKHFEVLFSLGTQSDWNDYAVKIAEKIPEHLKTPWFQQLSQNLQARNKLEQAIGVLDSGLSISPDDFDLKFSRVLMYQFTAQNDLMLEKLELLHKEKPDNPNIHNALGYTLADMNIELERAQKLIESALKHYPNSPAILDSMGWLQFRLGQFEASEKWLSRSLSIEYNPEVAAHLVEVLAATNQTEKAHQVLTDLKKRFPDFEIPASVIGLGLQ